MVHKECRYCDGGFRPAKVEGDLVYAHCGAAWDPITVEDDEE